VNTIKEESQFNLHSYLGHHGMYIIKISTILFVL